MNTVVRHEPSSEESLEGFDEIVLEFAVYFGNNRMEVGNKNVDMGAVLAVFVGEAHHRQKRTKKIAKGKFAIDAKTGKNGWIIHKMIIAQTSSSRHHLCYNRAMNNEIEAQFLDIDKAALRAKLEAIGAKLVRPEVLMRRVVFDLGEHSFARVRDEGDKIVMTYKRVENGKTILGTKEVNVQVDDYDNAILFLQGCGLKIKARQETLREVWTYGGAEICIDTWPWIPTFVEIEAPSENEVWATAERLGLDKTKAKYGSVDTAYQHYYGVDPDVVNMHTPEIGFDVTPPEWARK